MVTLSRERLERPVEETARALALMWLEEADDALDRLPDPSDDEALHDFRVSLRRLRSSLRAYRPYLKGSTPKKIQRQLRDIAAATNVGRDAEVQILWLNAQADRLGAEEQAGLRWLLERLEARCDEAYANARDQIAREYRRARGKAARRLSAYAASVDAAALPARTSFADVTAELIDEHAARLRGHLSAIGSAQDQESAHSARIAAKRLRYLIEPLRDATDGAKALVKEMKRLQDVLGELNDSHVLGDEIAAAMETVAAERARRLHQLALEELRATADAKPERESTADESQGLLALARMVGERRDRLFATLETDWLGEAAAGFFQRARELTGRLRGSGVGAIAEIERKYLLTALPDAVRQAPAVQIDQGWLPGDAIQERLRRVRGPDGVRHFRTVKSGSGLRRVQLEEPISRRRFQSLWPLTEGLRIRKRRYKLQDNDLTWEIDDFTDRPLVLAEVELSSEEQEVKLPEWLAPLVEAEVTGRPEYENLNLARRWAGGRAKRSSTRRRKSSEASHGE